MQCNHSAMVTNYIVLVKARAILKTQSKLYRQEIKVPKIVGKKEEGLRFQSVLSAH